jgi:hypothetical protein
MDIEKLADRVVELVQSRIDKALAPVLERLSAVEAKEIPEASAILKSILAGDELATLVNMEVTAAVEAIPVPQDGKDGVAGEKGEPGRDGIGLAGALIDRDGNLIVTLANGEAKSLGAVVGKDGQNGKDGVGFESLEVSFDGEAIVHEYKSADRTVTQRFPIQVMKHIGFWREGMSAKSGNTVTEDGSLWLCLKDTSERPGYSSDAWTLAARKGRNGQDKTEAKSEPVKLNGN